MARRPLGPGDESILASLPLRETSGLIPTCAVIANRCDWKPRASDSAPTAWLSCLRPASIQRLEIRMASSAMPWIDSVLAEPQVQQYAKPEVGEVAYGRRTTTHTLCGR